MKLPANFRKILTVALIVSVLSAGISTFLLFNRNKGTKGSQLLTKLSSYSQKEPEKNSYNILLLGYGGAGHSGGGLSDALVLLNINTAKKIVSAIAIPRDIWIELPVRSDKKEFNKINAAFAIGNDDEGFALKEPIYKGDDGGGNMAKKAVEEITGITVDYYAAVDFDRFVRSIDALKGVVVNVPVSFTDEFYPIKGLENETCGFSPEEMIAHKVGRSGFELEKIYTCRYEKLEFIKGPTQMDGATALKFIRSRHSSENGGDFARGIRQQAVLVAIKDKLLTLGALENIDEFYAEFSKLIQTDIKEENILELLSKFGNPQDYTIENLNITTENYLENSVSSDGQYILIPKAGLKNWNEVHTFLENALK